jgi:hypothetical protein
MSIVDSAEKYMGRREKTKKVTPPHFYRFKCIIRICIYKYIFYDIIRMVIRAPAQEYNNNMFCKKGFVFRLYSIRSGGQTYTHTHTHTHIKHTVNAKTRSPHGVGTAVVAVATNYTPPSLLA